MKYFLILIIVFFSCQTKNNSFENFSEFNRKFHSDSVFQMQRVKFPLKGELETEVGKEKWNKKNWKMLKTLFGADFFASFKQEAKLEDNVAVEKIWLPDGNFEFERKFERISDKWYLVYLNKKNISKKRNSK